jgi:hypothetical protein
MFQPASGQQIDKDIFMRGWHKQHFALSSSFECNIQSKPHNESVQNKGDGICSLLHRLATINVVSKTIPFPCLGDSTLLISCCRI